MADAATLGTATTPAAHDELRQYPLAHPFPAPRALYGWNFTFQLSSDTSYESLHRDRPPFGWYFAVHDLRAIAFVEINDAEEQHAASAAPVPSNFSGAADPLAFLPEAPERPYLNPLAARRGDNSRKKTPKQLTEVEHPLEAEAHGRLEPLWLEITPDEQRDRIVQEVIANDKIWDLWARVAVEGGGRPPPTPKRAKAPGQDPKFPKKRKLSSQELQYSEDVDALTTALSELCNALRTLFRQRLGVSDQEPDEGWGICVPNGSYSSRNPYPEEPGPQPDLLIVAQHSEAAAAPQVTPRTFSGFPNCPDVLATMMVRDEESEDLCNSLTNCCFSHARRVLKHHPFCTRSHLITVCGTRLRLWQFTSTTYATSRAYSFSKAKHLLPIARILALFVASDSDSLLRQWSPASIFEVRVPNADDEYESTSETWQWTDTRPRIVCARARLWGKRTAIFAGPARLLRPAESHSTLDERGQRLNLDGGQEGRLTMVKCTLVPERLLGHEYRMQRRVAGPPGTPSPIGVLSINVPPAHPPSYKPPLLRDLHHYGSIETPLPPAHLVQAAGPRHVDALVYQHALGKPVPVEMAERDLCKPFSQLIEQLSCYAQRGLHYRDLTPENLLCRLAEDGEPQLVLVDHGTMRLEGSSSGLSDGDDEDDETTAFLSVAEDDAHSANSLFMASGVTGLQNALYDFKSLEAEKRQWQRGAASPTQEQPEISQQTRKYIEDESLAAHRDILLKLHSHLDDLESSCYVFLYYGLQRSFAACDLTYSDLFDEMQRPREKQRLWKDSCFFWDGLHRNCYAMSNEWVEMMRKLRRTIRDAQKERRDHLESDLVLESRTPGELCKLTKIERECFRTCQEICAEYLPKLGTSSFVPPRAFGETSDEGNGGKEGGDGSCSDDSDNSDDNKDKDWRTITERIIGDGGNSSESSDRANSIKLNEGNDGSQDRQDSGDSSDTEEGYSSTGSLLDGELVPGTKPYPSLHKTMLPPVRRAMDWYLYR